MTRSVFKAALAASIGAAALSACVNVLPEPPKPDAVYRFNAPTSTYSMPATLIVREPDAPRLIAGRQLVSEGTNAGLRVVRGVEWVDRVTRLFQVTLVDSFDSTGGGYAVDDTSGISGDYELYWRVTDFTLKGSEAVCALRLTLMTGGTRMPVAQWTTQVSGDASAGKKSGARTLALAETGEACVSEAARSIAAEVEKAEAAEDAD